MSYADSPAWVEAHDRLLAETAADEGASGAMLRRILAAVDLRQIEVDIDARSG